MATLSSTGRFAAGEACADNDILYGPYATIAAAHAALLNAEQNVIGRTVGIQTGNTIEEYWYQGGTEQANLVKKQSSEVEIDTNPTQNSTNAVSSGGVYNALQGKANTSDIPTISTNITTDATSDTKTASPKSVKTYVDNGLTGKQNTISASSKISSDFVDDTNGTNKFVTTEEKTKINNSIQGVKQNGTLITPESGVVDVTVQDGEDGEDGLSAFEIAQQQGYTGTVDQWLASLKANIGEFLFVSTDAAAVTAMATIGQTYSSAIDPQGKNVAPTQNTLSVILLMNDDATTPSKTMMIATQEVTPATTPATYEFIYAGDLQSAMPSNVLTEDNLDDKHLENPASNSLAKAKDVEEKKLDKQSRYSANLIDPTKVVEGYLNIYGVISTSGQTDLETCEEYIPFKGKTICVKIGASTSQYIETFATYDSNKVKKRVVYGKDNVSITPEAGEVYVRITFRITDYSQDYPTAFACYYDVNYTGGLAPYDTYEHTDYYPLVDEKERATNAENALSERIGDLEESIPANLQETLDEKVEKIPWGSNNIANPTNILVAKRIASYGAINDAVLSDTAKVKYLVYDVFIPVLAGKDIFVGSCVGNTPYGHAEGYNSYAEYDASQQFIANSAYEVTSSPYVIVPSSDSVKYVKIAFYTENYTTAYPAPFIAYIEHGSTNYPLYDEYSEGGDYKPVHDLDVRVTTLENTIGEDTDEINNLTIPKLYMISNDIAPMGANTFWNPRDLSLSVWVDRLFDWNWIDNLPRKITWKENNSDRISFVAPFIAAGSPDSGVYNGGENIHVENYTKQLTTGIVDKNVPIQVSSVLNSATANMHPKVLFIGDSVTYGSGSSTPASLTRNEDNTFKIHTYWEYIWKLFYDDRKKNGNSGFAYTSLGTIKGSTFTYDGSTHFINAEGHGGWTTADYLNAKTTSPFYDANKTWTGNYATELNNAGVKFSLAKYIEKYRTLDDSGERLNLGDGTGTEITSSNIDNISVCTPNIISIQLGFNDNIANSFNDIKLLVKAIKNEYPTMKIMVSLIDEAGTYYPEKYTEYDSTQVKLNTWTQAGSKLHHKMFTLVSNIMSDDFLIQSNGIYFCPNYFIQPTAYSLTVRECPNAASMSGFDKLPYNVEVGSGPHVHPSTIAHAAWGYQFAALIKHIIYAQSQE